MEDRRVSLRSSFWDNELQQDMLSFQEVHSLFREGQEQAILNNRQKALEIFSRIVDCERLSSGKDTTQDW